MRTPEQRKKHADYMREYIRTHPEQQAKRRERNKKYYADPEKRARILELARKRDRENPERARQRGFEYRMRVKLEIIAAYGGKCACCPESAPEFLTVDHINNDGHLHRRKMKETGINFYKWLRKNGFPKDDFQLLCFNCNCAKALYGTCPHQRG